MIKILKSICKICAFIFLPIGIITGIASIFFHFLLPVTISFLGAALITGCGYGLLRYLTPSPKPNGDNRDPDPNRSRFTIRKEQVDKINTKINKLEEENHKLDSEIDIISKRLTALEGRDSGTVSLSQNPSTMFQPITASTHNLANTSINATHNDASLPQAQLARLE